VIIDLSQFEELDRTSLLDVNGGYVGTGGVYIPDSYVRKHATNYKRTAGSTNGYLAQGGGQANTTGDSSNTYWAASSGPPTAEQIAADEAAWDDGYTVVEGEIEGQPDGVGAPVERGVTGSVEDVIRLNSSYTLSLDNEGNIVKLDQVGNIEDHVPLQDDVPAITLGLGLNISVAVILAAGVSVTFVDDTLGNSGVLLTIGGGVGLGGELGIGASIDGREGTIHGLAGPGQSTNAGVVAMMNYDNTTNTVTGLSAVGVGGSTQWTYSWLIEY